MRVIIFIIQHSQINAHYFKRIVGHAVLLNQVKMKNQDSTCHGRSLHYMKIGRNLLRPYILYSLVGA